jgi:hypothetical protein
VTVSVALAVGVAALLGVGAAVTDSVTSVTPPVDRETALEMAIRQDDPETVRDVECSPVARGLYACTVEVPAGPSWFQVRVWEDDSARIVGGVRSWCLPLPEARCRI